MASASQKVFCFVKAAQNIILGIIICIVLQMMTKKKKKSCSSGKIFEELTSWFCVCEGVKVPLHYAR